ncbi:glycosyltransferase family A protein [Flavobacterium sp. XGLA_31]|uniref:glycosyltransferase family A protein n=1 Tax=Flavobacterium sp. XGLA_31 TaxID=3447666 RepID=UPI003F3AF041
MRSGFNPEKIKEEKNVLKPHRVVVVFYIPEIESDYYREAGKVLDVCLDSLIKTINPETTNITLINNNSTPKVEAVVEKYRSHLDKYVFYNENKGKVFAVLNEVRGVFEPFVTITDSDMLFYSGWEKSVFEVFRQFPQAGVVSPIPLPYLTFHYNQNVFGFPSFSGQIQYGKFVDDEDIELYLKGTNLPNLINRKAKYNWKEKQFVLKKKNGFTAVIGAYHVVSTYRTDQFRNVYTFPELKFQNSYETNFIDCLANPNGFFRLSTMKTFAYHIGNNLDDVVEKHQFDDSLLISPDEIDKVVKKQHYSSWYILWNRFIGKLLIKHLWNK